MTCRSAGLSEPQEGVTGSSTVAPRGLWRGLKRQKLPLVFIFCLERTMLPVSFFNGSLYILCLEMNTQARALGLFLLRAPGKQGSCSRKKKGTQRGPEPCWQTPPATLILFLPAQRLLGIRSHRLFLRMPSRWPVCSFSLPFAANYSLGLIQTPKGNLLRNPRPLSPARLRKPLVLWNHTSENWGDHVVVLSGCWY